MNFERMAQQVFLDKDKLICSICLDLQKDPVTIPCGHSYCLECIQNFWSGEEPKAPSCPQCRQSFTSRPVLVRNTILAELVEDARKAELQPSSSERSGTGPEHVDCDFCEGKKLKAAMSCLTCMVSYCEQHLQPHFSVAALKKHKLVKATLKLQENICPRHDEVMKIFCRTDQKCICSLLEQKVTSYQMEEVRKVEELQEKMQHEITKLKKTEAELDQLSSTEDHLHFLNNYSSLSDLSVCTDLPRFEQISDSVDVFLPEDFRSREDFMKFYHQITLDPNTANRNVSLSEQNRTATWTMIKQNYSSHPDRFAERSQVLSAEGLTGCCYWEVEWSGGVFIAVAYKDRSGAGTWDESVFGFNDKSWALRCSNTEYTFYHNNRCVSIAAPRSSRVGVYLNHKAGSLSFYSVSDSMTLLHKVQTTFTQTLYAGFWMSKSGSMIRLLK
uniref:Tripartite motif-containing protein 16-like n=1 Tax=Oryzias sinensis TaxID=183150 RepID=A0A8C7Y711_9TELE